MPFVDEESIAVYFAITPSLFRMSSVGLIATGKTIVFAKPAVYSTYRYVMVACLADLCHPFQACAFGRHIKESHLS